MKPTIYISGPITHDPDYKVKFKAAQDMLEKCGFCVLSPPEHVKVAEGKEWEDYMAEAIALMLKADQVYMLKGWSASAGAKLERRLAQELGKEIKYE